MNKHTKYDLKQMQSLPLSKKILMSEQRIREWYDYYEGNVYISFSGGKDSTVLLHLVRNMYPDVEAVFVDTGLEYPEIKSFVKTIDNVTILRPKKTFKQVIDKYGYPIISKEVSDVVYNVRKNIKDGNTNTVRYKKLHGTLLDENGNKSTYNISQWKFLLDSPFKISNKCCDIIKKSPIKQFENLNHKKPYIGLLAEESRLRKTNWIRYGCNTFNSGSPTSNPLSFWTENDILQYIVENNLKIADIYGNIITDGIIDNGLFKVVKYKLTGLKRTGCMFCMFGVQLEKEPNRFQRMKITHPKIYDYCLKPKNEGGLGLKEVLDYINVKY